MYGKSKSPLIKHEPVYTVISKHPQYDNILVASYYFYRPELLQKEINPIIQKLKPFRFRYYEFLNENSTKYAAIMRIHKPSRNIETKLQKNLYHFYDKKFPLLKGREICNLFEFVN